MTLTKGPNTSDSYEEIIYLFIPLYWVVKKIEFLFIYLLSTENSASME